MAVTTDPLLFSRLRGVLERDWVDIPTTKGFGGTGAPGKLLEQLLGVDGGSLDIPDAGQWEIKFHSGAYLLTLFHLEGRPKGHMHHLIREFGWKGRDGRMCFRHTVRGRSPMGFYVANESNRITVRHGEVSDIVWPHWDHDRLMNAFAAKLRRLIVVHGKRKNGKVRFDSADLYWEPQITLFTQAVEMGIVAIDFDARTSTERGLRNHGTKFRVKYEHLHHLYLQHQKFSP